MPVMRLWLEVTDYEQLGTSALHYIVYLLLYISHCNIYIP